MALLDHPFALALVGVADLLGCVML